MLVQSDNGVLGLSETSWEKVALTRWGAYLSDVEQRAILQAQKLAGAPASALEVGCEGGRWSLMLAQMGWKMTCTDVNQEALAVCQKRVRAANCILVEPGSKTIPCGSNLFDLLLCIEVAPVIQSDWFVDEAHRVLKNGGVLVGVNWNRISPRGLLVRSARRMGLARGDFYKVSYPRLRSRLLAAQFRIVHEEGFCWGPFKRDSNSSLIPLFVKLERLLQLTKIVSVSPWIVFIARKTG